MTITTIRLSPLERGDDQFQLAKLEETIQPHKINAPNKLCYLFKL